MWQCMLTVERVNDNLFNTQKKRENMNNKEKRTQIVGTNVCYYCGGNVKLFKDSVLLRGNGNLQKGNVYVCQKCGKGVLIAEDKKVIYF